MLSLTARRRLRFLLFLASLPCSSIFAFASADWAAISPDELQMKDLPEQPGAPAFATGDHAARGRSWMAHANETERLKVLDHYLEQSLKNVSVQKASSGDANAHGTELIEEYQITAQNYAQHSGPMLLVRVRVVGDKNFTLDWAKRKFPVELAGASLERDVYEIQLPPGCGG